MHPVFSDPTPQLFASDNAATVHPLVMRALEKANRGHVTSYGDDPYTRAAEQAFDALFERKVRTFFVYNGTGANDTGLATLVRPHQAIVCTDSAHIYFDECGAPEHLTGCKLLPVPAQGGKLRPEQLDAYMAYHGSMHHVQPAVLSLTQATEMGTLYTLAELKALCAYAHAHGMKVHMDGARIANAVVALGCTMADMTWKVGVDVLSFGGTKNGLMFGEAVVFFDDTLAEPFIFTRKNCGQLASKMRYIAAQYLALLEDDLWRTNAAHANAQVKRLAEGMQKLPGVSIVERVEINALFVQIPKAAIEPLREACFFYTVDEPRGIIRLVTSWDTETQAVEDFLAVAGRLIQP